MSHIHYFTVSIPVKPYIKKYITSMHGETILLHQGTNLGFLMLNVLSSRLESKQARGYIDKWAGRYTEKMVFRIPYHFFSITKKEVSPLTVVLVNRGFENDFEWHLCTWVEIQRRAGMETKKAIEAFCDHYGIELEVDISFDAIKKQEYRARKNFEKISRNLSREKNLFTGLAKTA